MGNDISDEVDSLGFLTQTTIDRDSAHEDCKENGSHLKPEHRRDIGQGKSIYHCGHCGDTYTDKSLVKRTSSTISPSAIFSGYGEPVVQNPIEMFMGEFVSSRNRTQRPVVQDKY